MQESLSDPDRMALWRYGVIGPLVSAHLDHGDRRALFREIAARTHLAPDGRRVRLSPRTIEGWFYAWKRHGLAGLREQSRADRGSTSIRPELRERLLLLKEENPRRSIPRLIRILERAGEAREGELSKSAVLRFLRLHGLSGRTLRASTCERRAFRHSQPGELWMGDILHGPLVLNEGKPVKCYLVAFIDSATRFVVAGELRLSERAEDHEYALRQAILKHGCPRALYLDNGSAQISQSLLIICAELSIRLLHTEAFSPESKGAIERWFRTWREEVESELPDHPLPLAELKSRSWSWVTVEYNARTHTSTGRSPYEHWLADQSLIRPAPPPSVLDQIFLHRERRKVRKDGTVRFRGSFLEVHSSLVGRVIELRFDPFDETSLPKVFLDQKFVSDAVLLDPYRNSTGKRHRPSGRARPDTPKSGLDPLGLIQDDHLRRAKAPGDSANSHDDDEMEDFAHV